MFYKKCTAPEAVFFCIKANGSNYLQIASIFYFFTFIWAPLCSPDFIDEYWQEQNDLPSIPNEIQNTFMF